MATEGKIQSFREVGTESSSCRKAAGGFASENLPCMLLLQVVLCCFLPSSSVSTVSEMASCKF
jgi:hypothetical protein